MSGGGEPPVVDNKIQLSKAPLPHTKETKITALDYYITILLHYIIIIIVYHYFVFIYKLLKLVFSTYRCTIFSGTAGYMSPEIVSGLAYSAESDVWSMGCVLYEMLSLETAFNNSNLLAFALSVSK